MRFNLEGRHRRSIRLKGYDYSQTGVYFVTICAYKRECLFGEINNSVMSLNKFGQIVRDEWIKTKIIRSKIKLDEFMIMPNHFHGIIIIFDNDRRGTGQNNCRGTGHRAPTVEQFGKPTHNSIPTIIRSFKSVVTKRINQLRKIPDASVWQRNYYEHVIRHDDEFNRIREYIINNPLNWRDDENYTQ